MEQYIIIIIIIIVVIVIVIVIFIVIIIIIIIIITNYSCGYYYDHVNLKTVNSLISCWHFIVQ